MSIQTNEVPSKLWRYAATLMASGFSVKVVTNEGGEVSINQVEQIGRDYCIGLAKEEELQRKPVVTDFRLAIASDEEMMDWSYGYVRDHNPLTLGRPRRTSRFGLISEQTFGPRQPNRCECGRFNKAKFEGVICDRCGVEIVNPEVRFYRFGHIELFQPIIHPKTKLATKVLPVLPAGLRTENTNLDELYTTVIKRNNTKGDIQGAVHALFHGFYPSGQPVMRRGERITGLIGLLQTVEFAP